MAEVTLTTRPATQQTVSGTAIPTTMPAPSSATVPQVASSADVSRFMKDKAAQLKQQTAAGVQAMSGDSGMDMDAYQNLIAAVKEQSIALSVLQVANGAEKKYIDILGRIAQQWVG